MAIINKIKHFRVMRGYDKQKDFIDALEKQGITITRVGLSVWERNRSQPKDEKRAVIARVLRVKPHELFIYE